MTYSHHTNYCSGSRPHCPASVGGAHSQQECFHWLKRGSVCVWGGCYQLCMQLPTGSPASRSLLGAQVLHSDSLLRMGQPHWASRLLTPHREHGSDGPCGERAARLPEGKSVPRVQGVGRQDPRGAAGLLVGICMSGVRSVVVLPSGS